MDDISKKIGVLLLVAVLLLGGIPFFVSADETELYTHVPTYENTYVNTGNQRQDLLGVALTQLGYEEGSRNSTKYGDWYGAANQPWCAAFVSWCARQAEIPTSVIPQAASVSLFNVKTYHGSAYSPKAGDLFFNRSYGHMGIVWYVDGEYFYTLEGNGSDNNTYDGKYVTSVKRRIATHYFGVPVYESCEESHTYSRLQEQAHPHRNYYKCNDCDNQFYAATCGFDKACADCIATAGDVEAGGYYICAVPGVYLPVYKSNSKSSAMLCAVPKGEVAQVHGIDGSWAYLSFGGFTGYSTASYLESYYPKPQTADFTTQTTQYGPDEPIALAWEAVENAEIYRLELTRDGESFADLDLGEATGYTLAPQTPGSYTARLTAVNRTGSSVAAYFAFRVRESYTIRYYAGEGIAVPEDQRKLHGVDLTLSQEIPVREGYSFLGWAESETDPATYGAGAAFSKDGDVTLQAVWKENSAVAQSLEIRSLPDRKCFVLGETFDSTGLTLLLTYSDGSAKLIQQDFELSGFAADTLGTCTVRATVEGLSVTFPVEILESIPGDINKDGFVNRDDVMLLLWHINFPEDYPVETNVEFTGDNYVNRDDVMRLLWHINFPEDFPLIVE